MRLRYVTNNASKFTEVQTIVAPLEISQMAFQSPDILSLDPKDLIYQRAKGVFEQFSGCFFVDHCAIYFREYDFKLPGTLIEVFLDYFSSSGLCAMLKEDRSARAVCYAVYCDGKRLQLFEATQDGLISEEPHGGNGFGWDSIFIPDGLKQTLAELTLEKKLRYSPRTTVTQRIIDKWKEAT